MVTSERHSISKFIGMKFNRLTVLKDEGSGDHGKRVLAKCECGEIKSYYWSFIKNGHTKSCGCLNIQRQQENGQAMTKHGLTGHPLYIVWKHIRGRCYNPRNAAYSSYGGRGVFMCDEWRDSFIPFYEWCMANGWRRGLVIDKDRKSPNKNGNEYSPRYCSIITQRENCQHRGVTLKVEYNGEINSVSNFCRKLGVSYALVYSRLKRGMSTADAFELPPVNGGARYKNKLIYN